MVVPRDLPNNDGPLVSDIVLEDRGPYLRRPGSGRRMIIYLDTSAFVKLVIDEDGRRRGSPLVRRGVAGDIERHHLPRGVLGTRAARQPEGGRRRPAGRLAVRARCTLEPHGASAGRRARGRTTRGQARPARHGRRAARRGGRSTRARPGRDRGPRSSLWRRSTGGCSRPPSARASPRSAAHRPDAGAAQPAPPPARRRPGTSAPSV